MSSAPAPAPADDKTKAIETARATARATAKSTPLENAKKLRDIYDIDDCKFPEWVLDEERWIVGSDKSHKFDDTIVVYDDDDELNQVKELVEQREPVNVEMIRYYTEANLEKNFGWKIGAYGNSTSSELYPNIGIYCHARVTNASGKEEKNVHVMNLIGYAFDSDRQPDYLYFLNTYGGSDKISLQDLDVLQKEEFKKKLIQIYRKIWLKACYICKFKNLKNLWYYGVGNSNFSKMLPTSLKGIENFYNEIFAEAFGIDPDDSLKKHTLIDPNDPKIPINFCIEYDINVQNLQKEEKQTDEKSIPGVLFDSTISTPEKTLYINAWDPWSIIGNENNMFKSLDASWGRNSNMSVLGWSMTNSKLLPDIVGGGSAETSKILSMKQILDKIKAKDAGSSGASPPVSSDSSPSPSGKVAQFFMTYKSGDNGGLNGYDQCRKIVNAVKCLMAKNYKHIGLTYSANQEQTIKIWKEYNYPHTSDFDNGKEKTIIQTGIIGTGQAQTIGIHKKQEKRGNTYVDIDPSTQTTYIDDLTSISSDENTNFRKAFRIIPFTTMRYVKQGSPPKEVGVNLDESKSGNNKECIEAAKAFLQLPDSIILGWCNQDCYKMNDTLNAKQKFAIGGGVAASLSLDNSKYIHEYLQFLTSVWDEDVQEIVTQCSPSPISVDSPASSPPPSSSEAKPVEKKPFAEVLTTLVDKLSKDSENDAEIKKLVTTLPTDFLYLTDGDTSVVKKNLNSAEPDIKKMIEDFETAMDGADTNFYLGACRSIEAAYELDMSLAGSDDNKKTRAKLLLNLRKNSLLLKVPARWDYKEMEMGKVSGLPDNLDELMKFSLQYTIEYYSQDGGATEDEKKRFKELKIDKEPTDAILHDGSKIPGVDGRFIKGIPNKVNTCYFNTGLQLLLCDDDFLQLIVIAISKPIEQSEYQLTTDAKFKSGCKEENVKKTYDVVDNLTKLFELIRNDKYNIDFYNKLFNLLLPHSGNVTDQHDVSEFTASMLTLFQCIDNTYFVKLINNLTILTESYSTDDLGNIITSAKKKVYAPFLNLKPDIQNMNGPPLTLTSLETNLQEMGFTLDKIKLAIQKNPKMDETNLIDVIMAISDDDDDLKLIKQEIGKILPSFSIEGILDNMKKGTKQDIQVDTSNFSAQDQLKIQLLENSISKACILFFLYKICNGEDKDGSLQGLLNDKSISSDKSYNELSNIISSNYFDSAFNSKIQKFIDFINSIKSSDKVAFSKTNCSSNKELFNDVYTTLENEHNKLTKPTKKRNEIVDIKESSKYIIFFIDRTLGSGVKLNAKIEINKKLTINDKIYILQGYSLHIGKITNGSSHYVFVKCNPNDGEDALIINDDLIQNKDIIHIIDKQLYVSAVIYKQEEPIVHSSPSGGGFKPTHNTTATHTTSTPKSKHNSSFKVSSSSKSKGKSRSRSHTQRVK